MDFVCRLFLERAENELDLANVISHVTEDKLLQKEIFHLEKVQSFYSAAITHSYYSIFYAAKAYLLTKGVKTSPPEEHKKVFHAFEKFVLKGEVDADLLDLYIDAALKAHHLLGILEMEKKKRGNFTYQKLTQANRQPAHESMENALVFFKHLFALCESS